MKFSEEQLEAVRGAFGYASYSDIAADKVISLLTRQPVEFAEGEVVRHESDFFPYCIAKGYSGECRKLSTVESGAGELLAEFESATRRVRENFMETALARDMQEATDKWKTDRGEA